MSDRLPLTYEGYLVGRDLSQEGDPRALDDWARRSLQGGGWGFVHRWRALYGGFEVPGSNSQADTRLLFAGETDEALAAHSDGMPHTLERALVEGWVGMYRYRSGPRLRLRVWDKTQFAVWAPGEGWGMPWDRMTPPIAWQDLTEPERTELLKVWPSVVAWREGGAAPWSGVEIRTVTQLVTGHEPIAVVHYSEAPSWEDHILDGER